MDINFTNQVVTFIIQDFVLELTIILTIENCANLCMEGLVQNNNKLRDNL